MPDLLTTGSAQAKQLTTPTGLVFDVSDEGPAKGDLVILLHGFPQSRHAWRNQVPALASAGYRAIAPNQRGYSPGARPDPADLSNYHYDKLVQDVIDLAAATGHGESKFHLVGHDWGGSVSWGVASRHPERLRSLTILSRPHPRAFAAALEAPDGDQRRRSRHHTAYLDPGTAERLVANGAETIRERQKSAKVPPGSIEEYLSVVGNLPAMTAAVAWYQARHGKVILVDPIRVPTLYIWGDRDRTVGPMAAEGTRAFIDAEFRFEVLPGVNHFITDEAPEAVTSRLLEHIRRYG